MIPLFLSRWTEISHIFLPMCQEYSRYQDNRKHDSRLWQKVRKRNESQCSDSVKHKCFELKGHYFCPVVCCVKLLYDAEMYVLIPGIRINSNANKSKSNPITVHWLFVIQHPISF